MLIDDIRGALHRRIDANPPAAVALRDQRLRTAKAESGPVAGNAVDLVGRVIYPAFEKVMPV